MSELAIYDFPVPRSLIAQQPLANRADARLLVVERRGGTLSHWHVRDLPSLLAAGDCLVLNDTRVVPARLLGYRTTSGGKWEGLFLNVDANGLWRLLCQTRGKLTPGETITLTDRAARDDVRLRLIEKADDGVWIAFAEMKEDALAVLDRVGRVPLPPYIHSDERFETDAKNYQTVFARSAGSVAAPTAGLHFTPLLLNRLQAAGVAVCYVTLHVGLGTFRPIATETLAAHKMHSETGAVSPITIETIRRTRESGGRIIAVGTTTLRVLETAALGGELCPWQGETDLFIRPGFPFRVVDGLLTNFHWPRSTLLVLVCSFAGPELIRRAYQEAIQEQYRFFSFGDAMLII